ncbi:TetR family transcriptional regulator [uncultured Gulosibacter sp.]|uniref:TetR/AcrR family transcriptional regulator n=1 Tax=uncultured Gulosibacter sp. TaxID=1339167 RepID=UPI00288B538C|nr:TetR family transcriptional regulator [uncultured Gulosibacter sp.]
MTKLTSESVLEVAMQRLQAYGLSGLSMRGIATELEVQPGALYWHFANKQAMVAGVCDLLVAPLATQQFGDPVAAGLAIRECLVSVPDGAEMVASSIAFGLGAEAAYTCLLDACAVAGHTEALASTALHLVLGEVQHEQQRAQAVAHGIDIGAESVRASAETLSAGLQALFGTSAAQRK